MLPLRISTTDDLEDAARELLKAFPRKKIFAFYGEMGAGKTTFIKAICSVLGVNDVTSSPTFGLIHEYRTGHGNSLYHFDFYRIEKIEEVYDIGYEEYMYSGNYCFLEWPEIVEDILPEGAVRLSLRVELDDSREVEEMIFPV